LRKRVDALHKAQSPDQKGGKESSPGEEDFLRLGTLRKKKVIPYSRERRKSSPSLDHERVGESIGEEEGGKRELVLTPSRSKRKRSTALCRGGRILPRREGRRGGSTFPPEEKGKIKCLLCIGMDRLVFPRGGGKMGLDLYQRKEKV